MNKKLIAFSIIYIFLLLAIAATTSNVFNSENLSKKVLRFHILANSDESYDQELKLKVKDGIIEYSKALYSNCDNVEEAKHIARNNMVNYNNIAKEIINKSGYNYNVKTYVTKEFYNTRVYDNFTLPAGLYDSLKVEIGQGRGHNWWCVVFPTVCLSGCTEDFDEYLTEEEKDLITNDKYIVKFKIIEIIEKLKYKIKKEA